jgi:hypothetical protein
MNHVSQSVGSNLASRYLDLLPASGVAISVFDQSRHSALLYATDATSTRLDELHRDLGEGPLFDAVASGILVSVPDLTAAEQWPVFSRSAAELDVGAIFVFPLTLGAVCTGTVTCYRKETGPLTDHAAAIGASLSRSLAGPVFREAIRVAVNESPDFEAPIETRRAIHQATGMVLAQLNTTATDAFARIRAYAFSTAHTVEDVARQVITQRLNFAELPEQAGMNVEQQPGKTSL